MTYKGRFAPSPTGPLHLGSLVAALGSYLDARANHGHWLVRMEDIDPPREIPEAKVWIPAQLENHGLHWDEDISYQSCRLDIYQSHLEALKETGHIYTCYCSRQRIKELGGIYDGLCRTGSKIEPQGAEKGALRIRLNDTQCWADLVQGSQSFTPKQLNGDFVIKRRDGLFSYQLAVAVDDSLQEITHVIRGADLIDSTARQIHLQKTLGLSTPQYGHLPLVKNTNGQKLSKQNLASSLDETEPTENLICALKLLGQAPEQQLEKASIEEIINWAIAHWSLAKIPMRAALQAPNMVESTSQD